MNNEQTDRDIFGQAMASYFHDKDETDIVVHSPDFDDDVIPVPYLFRDFKEMPSLEQSALKQCKGKVLDAGCGAGSHSLYLQNTLKLDVTAIDTSKGAIEICKERGIENAQQMDFFELKDEKYDTILLLMNGSGIVGKLNKLDNFFNQLRNLLNPNGQVLIDSSDLSYLLDLEEDGGVWIDPNEPYYGEQRFSISYKKQQSEAFDWLYIDFNSLALAALKNEFNCELVEEGEHYDYLARLTVKTH